MYLSCRTSISVIYKSKWSTSTGGIANYLNVTKVVGICQDVNKFIGWNQLIGLDLYFLGYFRINDLETFLLKKPLNQRFSLISNFDKVRLTGCKRN